MAAVCSKCGFNNPPGMRFCGNCGTRLVNASPAGQESGQNLPVSGRAPSIDPERLGVMTGADLLERFHQAGLEASGQRRSVTVLFVDLTGYTNLSEELSDEELYELVQKYIRVLVNAVYKYEGMVDKLTGDGLMALFGAPIAHENNAERALRSAMDMQMEVDRLSRELDLNGRDLRIHIGLNAGTVIVGGLGSDSMMNYTAIGDSVNLARRLEEAAGPGEILVSESVFRKTYRLFDFDVVPALSLKNISRKVNAYRVTGQKAQPGQVRGLEGLHAPMIGRENEFSQVLGMVDRLVTARQGSVVLLVGEGGIGKSRLTSELKAHLNCDEVNVLEAHSLTYRKAIAYWIFQDMLRAYLELDLEAPEADVRSRLSETVRQVLGSAGAEKLPYLEHMLGLEPSDPYAAGRIRYLDAGQLRQQIFLAVRDLLVAEARRRPLLLILEDLHWADEASLALIRFILDGIRAEPLLIFAISRPFEGGAVHAIHQRASQRLADRYAYIRLQALPFEKSNQLLEALLSVPELPESFRQQIIQRSAGLPFYLEEILRMLIEDDVLYFDSAGDGGAGQWRLSPGADIRAIGVPDTLQGLILTRFDRLNPIIRKALQTASVVGYQFHGQVLRRVFESLLVDGQVEEMQDGEGFEEALQLLVEREFVIPQPSAVNAEESFIFKHVLVSDAVYSTLLQRDRKDLHTRAAQAIEAVYAGRIDGQIEVLASHYLRSPLLDRALHYLILAGQKAARSFVNEQARQHFAQALELLPKVAHSYKQAVQVHMGLGDALLTAGEYPAARDQYTRASEALASGLQSGVSGADLCEEGGEPGSERIPEEACIRMQSVLARKIGQTYERQGEYETALDCLQRAQSLLDQHSDSYVTDQANTLCDIGWIWFRRGNLDQAEALFLKALALSETVDQPDVLASVLNRLAGIYFQRDAPEQASAYLEQSLMLREQIGDVVAVARSYNNLGLLSWKKGDLASALDNFTHSFELQSNLGDVEGVIELHTNMGLIEMDRGNLADSERHFQQALEMAGQIGHLYHVSLARLHLSLLNLYAGHWHKVLDYAQMSLRGFQELRVKEHLLDLTMLFGWAYLGLGDEGHLEDALNRLDDLMQQAGGPSESEGRAMRLKGVIARRRGKLDQAKDALERSISIFTQLGSQIERARSLVELGSVYRLAGEPSAEKFSEAKRIFEHTGANFDLEKLNKITAR